MEIKQVSVVTHSDDGVRAYTAFDAEGEITMGSQLGAYRTISVAVRGTKGQTITALFDAEGRCVSGNGDAVIEALKGTPNAQIINTSAPASTEETVVTPDPAPASVLPFASSEGSPDEPEAAPEGDRAWDIGDDVPSEFGADGESEA